MRDNWLTMIFKGFVSECSNFARMCDTKITYTTELFGLVRCASGDVKRLHLEIRFCPFMFLSAKKHLFRNSKCVVTRNTKQMLDVSSLLPCARLSWWQSFEQMICTASTPAQILTHTQKQTYTHLSTHTYTQWQIHKHKYTNTHTCHRHTSTETHIVFWLKKIIITLSNAIYSNSMGGFVPIWHLWNSPKALWQELTNLDGATYILRRHDYHLSNMIDDTL